MNIDLEKLAIAVGGTYVEAATTKNRGVPTAEKIEQFAEFSRLVTQFDFACLRKKVLEADTKNIKAIASKLRAIAKKINKGVKDGPFDISHVKYYMAYGSANWLLGGILHNLKAIEHVKKEPKDVDWYEATKDTLIEAYRERELKPVEYTIDDATTAAYQYSMYVQHYQNTQKAK